MQFDNFSFSFSKTKVRASTGSQLKSASEDASQGELAHSSTEDADPYAKAGQELLTGQTTPALWARAMVEGNGAEGLTQAAYIRLRVAQLEEQAAENRRAAEQVARQRAHQENLRIAEVQKFAVEQGVTAGEAADMLECHIRKEHGRFVLYLDGGKSRYVYDQLQHAVQYSKAWQGSRSKLGNEVTPHQSLSAAPLPLREQWQPMPSRQLTDDTLGVSVTAKVWVLALMASIVALIGYALQV